MPSDQSPKIGEVIEDRVSDRYDLRRPDSGRKPWMDAVDSSGSPWEIKGAMRRRSSGSPGRIRIFREPHERLERASGYYGIAAYRPRGRGIEILDTNAVRARTLRLEWGPSGHSSPNRSAQRKIPVAEALRW